MVSRRAILSTLGTLGMANMLDNFNGLLNLYGQIVLDGAGQGVVRLAPSGETWSVRSISVSADITTSESIATVYEGQVSVVTRHSGTVTGSSGDTNTLEQPIILTDGKPLYIQWVGGTPGATATAVVTGLKTVTNRGFRAVP